MTYLVTSSVYKYVIVQVCQELNTIKPITLINDKRRPWEIKAILYNNGLCNNSLHMLPSDRCIHIYVQSHNPHVTSR